MLAAGNQANRLALAKPSVADRDMLPSHLAQHVGVRRAEDRNLGAALQRDHGPKTRRPYRTLLGNFGQVRGAEDQVVADALALGGGMAAEVAKVAAAIATQQAEVDDDSAPGKFVAVAGGVVLRRRLVFSFVVGRHVKPTVRHGAF